MLGLEDDFCDLRDTHDKMVKKLQKLAGDWEFYSRYPQRDPEGDRRRAARYAEELYEIVGRP